jgi:DNA polymerase III psi subunit
MKKQTQFELVTRIALCELKNISASEKLVLIAILSHYPDMRPAIPRIARLAKLSERQVQRHITTLEKLKYLTITRSFKSCNKYDLGVTSMSCAPLKNDDEPYDTHVTPPVTPMSPPGDTHVVTPVTPMSSKQTREQTSKQTREQTNTTRSFHSRPQVIPNCVSVYCEEYKKTYQVNPVITPKDAGLLNALAKSAGGDTLSKLIPFFFELKDPWFITTHHSVTALYQNISSVKAYAATGVWHTASDARLSNQGQQMKAQFERLTKNEKTR